MKKNLKQSSLFERLKFFNINVKQYILLYQLYIDKNLSLEKKNLLAEKLYDPVGDKITTQGENIIQSIDNLFAANKKIKLDVLMGVDYQSCIDEYINIFPTSKLPTGKYARGNKKNIETNFKWFFSEYNYSWSVIHDATIMYVQEYRAKNYLYMRTAMYFIRKDDGTRVVHSDLADYCDKIVNDQSYTRDKYFKTKIL
jgi:hypothetical protein